MTKPEILLIEDNEDHAEIIKRCLSDNKLSNSIVHIADGEEAIDFLMKNSNNSKQQIPSLILLDLRLPKVDGISILKLIKNHNNLKHIPVVILSSSDTDFDIKEAYSNYANSYLVKPFDFDKFKELINTFTNYWFEYNHFTNYQK